MYVKVDGYSGVAWRTIDDEWEPELYWTEVWDDDLQDHVVVEIESENPNEGKICCMMVGDDRLFYFDPEEVHEINLEEDDFCIECGQIGCGHLSARTYFGVEVEDA